jgi:hypothetical protein
MDFVPYLPPFSHHVVNKLYPIDESGSVAYIRSAKPIPWVDNAFVNFRAF